MDPEKPAQIEIPVVVDMNSAKPVTAEKLVSDDHDVFPQSNSTAMPASETTEPAPKRGRGRPPGAKNKATPAPEPTAPGSSKPNFDDAEGKTKAAESAKPIDYMGMSKMIFQMSTGTLANIFGPEWLPRPAQPGMPGEEEIVIVHLATYLKSKEIPDIPPGVMLCLVLSMYAAPRFQAPTTKEKVKGVWFWIKSKFTKRKKTMVVSETAREPEKPKKEEAEGNDERGKI